MFMYGVIYVVWLTWFGLKTFIPHISVPSSCTTGNITLVDGDNEMEGRVKVCRGGVWGAVYDDSEWNFNDAQVTCRQLGYPSECEYKIINVLHALVHVCMLMNALT